MIKAIQTIRLDGKRYSPGDSLPKLSPLQVEQLTAAGAIAVEPDPEPDTEPKKVTRRKPKDDSSDG